jgi:diphthamide biosynthesis protein 3
MGAYDEVEIEDMNWNEELQAFTYQCPCGDLFQITLVSACPVQRRKMCLVGCASQDLGFVGSLQEELQRGEEVARCPSCSLYITVVYNPVGGCHCKHAGMKVAVAHAVAFPVSLHRRTSSSRLQRLQQQQQQSQWQWRERVTERQCGAWDCLTAWVICMCIYCVDKCSTSGVSLVVLLLE